MNELVSVVVPVYNVEDYLSQCIESITNQTYKNIEIILINDGSKDNSLVICKTFGLTDNRIKIIDKKNKGLSSARNRGIRESSGKYICFIDSDDWVSPLYIENLYNLITINDCQIAQCDYTRECDDNSSHVTSSNGNVKIRSGIEQLYKLYDKDEYISSTVAWNKLYDIRLFDDCYYYEGIIHEDEEIIHQLLYKAERVIITSEKLYHYRIRNNSITSMDFSEKNLDIILSYKRRLEFLESVNHEKLVLITKKRFFRLLTRLRTKCNCIEISNRDLHLDKIDIEISNINIKKKYIFGFSYESILLLLYMFKPKICYFFDRILYTSKEKFIIYAKK